MLLSGGRAFQVEGLTSARTLRLVKHLVCLTNGRRPGWRGIGSQESGRIWDPGYLWFVGFYSKMGIQWKVLSR